MANLRVAVAIGRVGEFERYKHGMVRAKPSRSILQHLICKLLSHERGQKLVQNDPLMVPSQIARRCFEYAVGRRSVATGFMHERVVSLEHCEMQLRDQHVRIVPRIANDRDAVCIALHVGSFGTEQELRWIVTLVEEWMTGRSVAVQTFKVELRAARVAQFRRIGMAPQNRSVGRNIVSHKLTEDRPSGSGIAQRAGSVIGIAAIADATCTAERAQELLIRLERWQLGKHAAV